MIVDFLNEPEQSCIQAPPHLHRLLWLQRLRVAVSTVALRLFDMVSSFMHEYIHSSYTLSVPDSAVAAISQTDSAYSSKDPVIMVST